MFERFTDRARKVFALAHQEAQRFEHDYIGTEHILLGIVKEGSGIATSVLKNLGVDLHNVRTEVQKRVTSGSGASEFGRLPHTPGAKRVIEYAILEARGLDYSYIDTEHLLLGLLHEEEGTAAVVLTNLGVNLDGVRQEVLALLDASTRGRRPPHPEEAAWNWPIIDMDFGLGRSTDHARRVMALANREALRLNHEHIDTEHVLMGIAKAPGAGSRLLADLGADSARLWAEFSKLVKAGPDRPTTVRLPLAPRAEQVIERAKQEAAFLAHNCIGTDHLLLGLLSDEDGVAAQVLVRVGLDLDQLRVKVRDHLKEVADPVHVIMHPNPVQHPRAEGTGGPAMFERFTDRARKVMALANQEAQRFGHEYLGTEHILLGVVKEGSGVGANVLKNLQVDLALIRLEVEKLVKRGSPGATIGKLPQTPRAKKGIEYAILEARNLHHNYVGTEHLLLGLIREQDGLAAQVLVNLGLDLERVRGEVLALLGAGIEAETAPHLKGSDAAIKAAIRFLSRAGECAAVEGDQALATELLDKIEQLRALLVKPPGDTSGTPPSPTPPREEGVIPCPDDKCGHMNEPLARFCSRCGHPLQS